MQSVKSIQRYKTRISEMLKSIKSCQSGVVVVEFAYCLPIFTVLGFAGVETANMATTNTRVNQIAATLADNLSRSKAAVPLTPPELREVDIDDGLLGAKIQGGASVPILDNGRIVVSSLQQNASGKQTIAWQRCKGMKNVAGKYGVEGATQPASGTSGFQGMGPGTAAEKVKAEPNSSIIFVEITYDYKPVIATWMTGTWTLRQEAAFYVRDDRSLAYPVNPSNSSNVSACNEFNTTF
jgi:TadE-like protein